MNRLSSYFPNRRHLSYPNLTKNKKEEFYIRNQQNKKLTPKHKTIKTTTEVSHYIGTNSSTRQYKITGKPCLLTEKLPLTGSENSNGTEASVFSLGL